MAIIYSQNYRTLQRAFDALANGDTLIIAAGEYREEIYVTGKDNCIISPRGTVVVSPNRVANGFLFVDCDGWTITDEIQFKNCFMNNGLYNGKPVKREGHFLYGMHTAGLQLGECDSWTINNIAVSDSEGGIHANMCNSITINKAIMTQNIMEGIRFKRGDNHKIDGGSFTKTGLASNPHTPSGVSWADGHGVIFYGGDGTQVLSAYFDNNKGTALKVYEGTSPVVTTGFTIDGCELRASGLLQVNGEYALPLYIADINQNDNTFKVLNNGMLNLTNPTGSYLQVGNYGEGGLKTFLEMEAWLVALNALSIDNYVLPYYSLIVSTVGGATSNSYVSIEEAQDYFNKRLACEAWDKASESNRIKSLLQAARDLDGLKIVGMKFNGGAIGASNYQSMNFPRLFPSDLVEFDIEAVAGDMFPSSYNASGEAYIPIEVKNAQCEQALHLLQLGSTGDRRIQLQMQGVASMRLGTLSEVYRNGFDIKLISTRALDFMSPFIDRRIKLGRSS